jgi:Fe-S cluster biogenesis protein NfuA
MTTLENKVLVYTESTPNPGTLKFVANKMILPDHSADFQDPQAAQASPLAGALFEFPFVRGVFIASNFITITKDEKSVWHEIIPDLRDFIKAYLSGDNPIVSEEFLRLQADTQSERAAGGDVEGQIHDILEKYVRPAIEMDGGAIRFKSYEEGIVTLQLQGSCSGCPSSTLTLKSGIEGMLKRMIPEVKEVVAEEA